jgi:uncharacterized protein YraI
LQPIEHPLRSDFIPKQFRIGSNGENWESSVMSPTRLPICAAAFALLASGPAFADPAYVPSTVNLREAAGTNKPVLAKIPAGTRLEATNCNDWCEVEWQGKKGFVIANALDRRGKATESHAESKPATEPRAESKPVVESHPESKPAAKPRPASKSASEPRTTGSVARRAQPRRPRLYVEDDYVPMGPPVVYGRPYYYPYRPYVYAYRPYYHGYRRGYYRW